MRERERERVCRRVGDRERLRERERLDRREARDRDGEREELRRVRRLLEWSLRFFGLGRERLESINDLQISNKIIKKYFLHPAGFKTNLLNSIL